MGIADLSEEAGNKVRSSRSAKRFGADAQPEEAKEAAQRIAPLGMSIASTVLANVHQLAPVLRSSL